MLTPPLPDKINPWQLAAEDGRLEGELPLVALPRLVAALDGTEGTVRVALAAGTDGQNLPFIKGALRTEVELICQRCLGPLQLALDVPVSLGLVHGEAEFDRLPDDYDPLLVPENSISVTELVEDELLLALPQIPCHVDRRECEANGYGAPGPVALDAEHRQPFAVLATLLRDSK